jgi:hypothetical protein
MAYCVIENPIRHPVPELLGDSRLSITPTSILEHILFPRSVISKEPKVSSVFDEPQSSFRTLRHLTFCILKVAGSDWVHCLFREATRAEKTDLDVVDSLATPR